MMSRPPTLESRNKVLTNRISTDIDFQRKMRKAGQFDVVRFFFLLNGKSDKFANWWTTKEMEPKLQISQCKYENYSNMAFKNSGSPWKF